MKLLPADHPMLHQPCRKDGVVTLDQIKEMFALMRSRNAMGLAAPQVGIDARVFVTEWGQVFFGPEIVEWSKKQSMMREGCLSLPGQFWNIGRPTWIRLKSGERFEGMRARVVQHELDHLDGVLISD
jgi:peptide deformylase